MATNDRHKTHLIDIDHEDLSLGGRPRALVVIHLGYAQVLVVGCDYLGQLTHVFVQESTMSHQHFTILQHRYLSKTQSGSG